MTRGILLFAFCALVSKGSNAADPTKACVDGLELSFFENPKKNFNNAKQACVTYGGQLVKVDNARKTEEINRIITVVAGGGYFTGAKDTGTNVNWKWQDGTKVPLRHESGYQNWKGNQPNNGQEMCMTIGRETYLWVDSECNLSLKYICQKENTVTALQINENTPDEYTCTVSTSTGCSTPQLYWTNSSYDYVSTSAGDHVYMTRITGASTLHFENARISDAGTYDCRAYNGSNFVARQSIRLSVDGTPNITSVEVFTCNSSLRISWLPKAAAVGFRHRIAIQNGTQAADIKEKFVAPTSVVMQSTQFNDLNPLTRYQVQVTACKNECTSDYVSVSVNAVTGGIPKPVTSSSMSQTPQNRICTVTWSLSSGQPQGIVDRFEITLRKSFISARSNSLNEEDSVENVNKDLSSYSFQPQPNRRYRISIQVVNCAGPSPISTASGSCEGSVQAPTTVRQPEPSGKFQSDGTRMITVPKPDESNGLVSCLFVIVDNGTNQRDGDFTLEQLKKANGSQDTETGYITVAIQVSSFSNTGIKLGDGSQSSCDVFSPGSAATSGRKKRQTTYNRIYVGGNRPLKEGKYSVYVVSTTPSGSNLYLRTSQHLKLQNTLIDNQEASGGLPTWIIVVCVILFLTTVAAVIGMAILMKKRRNPQNENSRREMSPQRNQERAAEAPISPQGGSSSPVATAKPAAVTQNPSGRAYENFNAVDEHQYQSIEDNNPATRIGRAAGSAAPDVNRDGYEEIDVLRSTPGYEQPRPGTQIRSIADATYEEYIA